MTSASQALNRMRKFDSLAKKGLKGLRCNSRCASTASKCRIVDGPKGEKIIYSPISDISYPSTFLQDFVWKNINNYENKIALECSVTGRKYTFAESRDASNYIARSLVNLGLKQGDVVALITPNLPETALAFLGILEAGLVVTTVNPFYTVDETTKQLKHSNAKAVICAAEIASTAQSAVKVALPTGTPFIVISDGTKQAPEGSIPFLDLVSKGKTLPQLSPLLRTPDDLAVLPFSSGTTGMPKGVMLSDLNLVSNIQMVDNSLGKEVLRPTTDSYQEVIPAVLPFFHIFGMNVIMLTSLTKGFKLVTLPKFVPELFIKVLENYKASVLYSVPPIILFLAASPFVKKSHLENLHSVFSGAAPLSAPDVERLYKKLEINESAVKFCQGYGLTETSPVSFIEKTGKKFSSIGKPICNCEARIVDPLTNEQISSPGKTGELWVRGPHVMKGYLNNEAATKETITDDGWLKSGDIVYFDQDEDFFVTDRLKELIKVKGFQVAPAELEALLRTHPDVEEAAVIGIPDEKSGEVPKAFIVPKKGKKPVQEDIQNFVKGKVSEFKELRGGVALIDAIPKNTTGKILRSHLKLQFVNNK
ncbi:uncharacterized protein [Prorops nasuta]|uniref:uncharacterized protein n=1 Tax=Prorops nasuta TaxID=863751 RepID=UPI0034CEA4FC